MEAGSSDWVQPGPRSTGLPVGSRGGCDVVWNSTGIAITGKRLGVVAIGFRYARVPN
jgi:hypothetical protein